MQFPEGGFLMAQAFQARPRMQGRAGEALGHTTTYQAA